MMERLVMDAPQPRVGRHGCKKYAARLQHAECLAYCNSIIVNVLQRIKTRHQIKKIVGKGKPPRVAADQFLETAISGESQGVFGNIKSGHAPEFTQRQDITPGAAAHVKDFKRAGRGTLPRDIPRNRFFQNLASRDVPEIKMFPPGKTGILIFIHEIRLTHIVSCHRERNVAISYSPV